MPAIPSSAETAAVRFWAGDTPRAGSARPRGASYSVLALSGGGPDGAYGAGLLAGLGAAGARPDFDVVTGVSTGALMAPFVFLGPSQDEVLRELYTGPDVETLLEGGLLALLDQPGLYRHREIRVRIERYVTADLLAAIAAEHRRGRRLYVATGSLDAQRKAVWDMGAIAARGTAHDLILFREVLTAAMSIPLLFPPVALPATDAASFASELHADASLFAGFYAGTELFPEPGPRGCGSAALRCRLYVLVHNKLLPEPELLPLHVGSISARAVQSMVKANLTLALNATYQAMRSAGIQFGAARLRTQAPGVSPIHFERSYMQRIYAEGFDHGSQPDVWRDLTGLFRPDPLVEPEQPAWEMAQVATERRPESGHPRAPLDR